MNIKQAVKVLKQGSKYVTNKEKDNILDFIEYLITKNNVVEDKNIELVLEIERLNNIIKEVRKNINKKLNINSDYVDYDYGTELLRQELLETLDKGNVKAIPPEVIGTNGEDDGLFDYGDKGE